MRHLPVDFLFLYFLVMHSGIDDMLLTDFSCLSQCTCGPLHAAHSCDHIDHVNAQHLCQSIVVLLKPISSKLSIIWQVTSTALQYMTASFARLMHECCTLQLRVGCHASHDKICCACRSGSACVKTLPPDWVEILHLSLGIAQCLDFFFGCVW